MTAYYNEIEPFAARWLRNLIGAGLIATGEVDERSIRDVQADDIRGFRQCHFFAGIGVWSYALRGAGWPDDRPVWTGSCPCQPFSAAGKREGFADDRHLWPEFFRLIRECRPDTVFGEQVSSPAGLGWLDAVFSDLEGAEYACGALDTCAAGVGAPHIRQRLYWVAQSHEGRRGEVRELGDGCQMVDWTNTVLPSETEDAGPDVRVANALPAGRAEGRPRPGSGQDSCVGSSGGLGDFDETGRRPGALGFTTVRDRYRFEKLGRVADADGGQPSDGKLQRGGRHLQQSENPLAGFWADADWLRCRPELPKYPEGRWRPVEPGTFPLAHGVAGRVGRLRAYGNALCAPQAEAFVRAAMECLP